MNLRELSALTFNATVLFLILKLILINLQMFQIFTFKYLQTLNWPSYLVEVFKTVMTPKKGLHPKDIKVVVQDINYFSKLGNILQTTNPEIIGVAIFCIMYIFPI